MSSNRIYQAGQLSVGSNISLDQRASHHLLNVLRMQSGNEVILFNGDDKEYPATLTIHGKTITAFITNVQNAFRESPLHITLAQGVCRGDRMDWAIQKAVELGVGCIAPIYCERSMKALDTERAEKKQQHWQGIVISACEQSGRCRLPILAATRPLSDYLSNRDISTKGFVLDPSSEQSLKSSVSSNGKIEILIGPEGGLCRHEIEMACKTGYQRVGLGPRILRTETAGVAALAIIQAELGDLK
ncbi:MAG: 16S rRNA (uracil(1498)-N(3))-methyltransferase [Gammaproteobacteria bacterium]|nr:16S rRNA (uracil(1498)-N(3))-methyltransferase [Gammaproteobacteria bacterium]